MKKAIILARVSTPEQQRSGLSLDEIQLPKLREYVASKGYELDKEFTFQETASQKLRKQFDEMVRYIKSDPEIIAIVAIRIDRLTRNFRDAVEMDDLRLKHDKELHFLYEKLVLNKESFGADIDVWDNAVHDAKKHINRCQAYAYETMQSKLKTGQLYGKAPYGYRNTSVNPDNPDSKRTVVTEPFEAGIVKIIFDLYTAGANSYLSISKKLKDEYNVDMYKSKVEKIIRNPFYMGKMKHKDELYPHIYETIVSDEVFQIATDIRTGRKRTEKKGKLEGKHGIYRGLLYCAECGCSFTPTPRRKVQKNGNVHEWVYYYCTNAKRQHENKPTGIEEKQLTKQFADLFKKMNVAQEDLDYMTERLKQAHIGKVNYNKELFDTYTNEIKKRDTRLENMYIDKIEGNMSITQEQYDKLFTRFQTEKEEYLIKLNRLNKANEEYYIEASLLLTLASRSYELFLGSEPEQKREIIQLTLQNLSIKDGKLCYDWQKPFDSIFKTSKSLNWGG